MSTPIQLRWKKLTRAWEESRIFRDVIHKKSPGGYHSHDFCEVFLVEEGKGIHLINGSKQKLNEGHVGFIRARDCHAFTGVNEKGITLLNISFQPDIFSSDKPQAGRDIPEVADLFDDRRAMPFVWQPPLRLAQEVGHAFRHFVNGYRDKLAIHLFLLTMADLTRHGKDHLTEQAPDWLSNAFLTLDVPENLREGVQAVVRTAGRSAQHVCKEAKKHFGKTLGEIVSERRLELAAQMLELGTRNVTEIAMDCGYESISHFVRKFKATYGEPPLRYRNSRRSIPRG
jgi:AraC family cel operon transcriptional repressor